MIHQVDAPEPILMIEPTREQDDFARNLPYLSVQVCPPEEENGPVTIYALGHPRLRGPGLPLSKGKVALCGFIVDCDGNVLERL